MLFTHKVYHRGWTFTSNTLFSPTYSSNFLIIPFLLLHMVYIVIYYMIVKLCLGVRGKLAERATASVACPQGGLGASEASPSDVLIGRVPARRFAPLVYASINWRAKRAEKKPPTQGGFLAFGKPCSQSLLTLFKPFIKCVTNSAKYRRVACLVVGFNSYFVSIGGICF